MKIAILTPTRGRPLRLNEFMNSVLGYAHSPDQVMMFNYIDHTDPKLEEYKSLLAGYYRPSSVVNVYGEEKSVSKSWNDLASMAHEWGADVFIMGNDDLVYRTMDWDQKLKYELAKYPDEIYCAWMEDKINGERHCAFPIVSRKWYDTLGYFTPGVFHFGYNDTWLFDIARRIDRLHFLPHIVAEHMHGPSGKAPMDDTYARNRTQERGNLYEKDLVIFNNTNCNRQEDAKKLMKVMLDDFYERKTNA